MKEVKLNNWLKHINENIQIFGIEKLLQKLHQKHGKTIKEELTEEIHYSTYYYWLQGKTPIKIKYLKKLKKYDNNLLEKAYKKAENFSVGQKKCQLPKKINKDLSYLIGTIHGDGHLHKNEKYVTITVEHLDYLKKEIEPIIKELFNTQPTFTDFNTHHRLEIGSKVIYSFLSQFCPKSKKVGKLTIPNKIKENKKLLKNYLSGLFDTDGCIGHTKDKKQVYSTIVQTDKKFLQEIYNALKEINIDINKPRKFSNKKSDKLWRIYIGSKKDLKEFLQKIKFRHPKKEEKSRKVKEIINGSGRI